jgi:hypothetical protein
MNTGGLFFVLHFSFGHFFRFTVEVCTFASASQSVLGASGRMPANSSILWL